MTKTTTDTRHVQQRLEQAWRDAHLQLDQQVTLAQRGETRIPRPEPEPRARQRGGPERPVATIV